MPPFSNPFAGRSRGTRAMSLPKTPEPLESTELKAPSPPRPRFRLRKKNASQLSAPTQQFLASVAAADVPIPSIEEPHVVDQDMLDTLHPIPHMGGMGSLGFSGHNDERPFSPPKTPAPGAVPFLSPKRFPDWSMGSEMSSRDSSPESSRPSTARSTQTSASVFSAFSFTSDGPGHCLSPETEHFKGYLSPGDAAETVRAPSRKQRRSQWSLAMTRHLWSTYLIYLQDPKVTPFRIGKSGIPPPGVCLRVAREAKRSWKGSNSQAKPDQEPMCGSLTPTVPGGFVRWPHTCAATRTHLRELCKANASTATRNYQYRANSPTPFGRAATRFRNRRSTPARSPSVFASSEMAMSLTVCTAESMQAQGPLAQLTKSQPLQHVEQPPISTNPLPVTPTAEAPRMRLGSPFMAKSYGPSSSNSLAATLGLTTEPRQAQTIGPQHGLQPSAKVTRSRAHTTANTQKRRDRPALFEHRRTKRPSIGSDLWMEPSAFSTEHPSLTPLQPQFSSTAINHRDDLFVPRMNIQDLFGPPQMPLSTQSTQVAAMDAPARLGSPLVFGNTSRSVPNRFSSPATIVQDAARRPFATVQQAPVDITPTTPNSSLASRIAYVDEALRDFRRRTRARRQSDSPS